MPNLGIDELLAVTELEWPAREARLAELLRRHDLDARRASELAASCCKLRARAAALSPPPSREALALGLLSLIALETRS